MEKQQKMDYLNALNAYIEILNTASAADVNFEDEILVISRNHVKLSNKNYAEIKECNAVSKNKTIVFIDGGSAVLLQSPQSILFAVRAAAVFYKNNIRIKVARHDIYCLAKAVYRENGKLSYEIEMFQGKYNGREGILPEEFLKFSVDSRHESLIEGRLDAKLEKTADIASRNAELLLGAGIAAELSEGDVIVFDGTFQNLLQGQETAFERLKQCASEKKAIIIALSKTSSILTLSGRNPFFLLRQHGPKKEWVYNAGIIKEEQDKKQEEDKEEFNKKAHENKEEHEELYAYFLKLNACSAHIFKADSPDAVSEEIFSLLSANSNDAVFAGYPFGLIDADQFARISRLEAQSLKAEMMINAGKDWALIKDNLAASDAHEILDKIRY